MIDSLFWYLFEDWEASSCALSFSLWSCLICSEFLLRTCLTSFDWLMIRLIKSLKVFSDDLLLINSSSSFLPSSFTTKGRVMRYFCIVSFNVSLYLYVYFLKALYLESSFAYYSFSSLIWFLRDSSFFYFSEIKSVLFPMSNFAFFSYSCKMSFIFCILFL